MDIAFIIIVALIMSVPVLIFVLIRFEDRTIARLASEQKDGHGFEAGEITERVHRTLDGYVLAAQKRRHVVPDSYHRPPFVRPIHALAYFFEKVEEQKQEARER